tara:strand:- start:340 stop:579 length:240 start_codon:yes stop_codon:yes gene_type:complete
MTGCHTRLVVLTVLTIAVLSSPVNAQQTLAELRARAEQGNAEALCQLGLVYEDGEAIRWYRLAAEQGHALAQYYSLSFL